MTNPASGRVRLSRCVLGRLGHPGHVLGVAHVGDVDARRIGQVSRTQAHRALGADSQQPGHDTEYPACRARGVVERPGGEKVQIGWPARRGQGRAQGEHHLEAGPGKAGLGGQVDGGQRVIDQVAPHAGQVGGHPDAQVAQRGGGADARTHHDGRAGVRACRHHDRISLNNLPAGKPDSARRGAAQLEPVHGAPARMARLGRPRAAARCVSALLIRRPSRTFRGAGPAPTVPGSLWSPASRWPAATAASAKARCQGDSSPGAEDRQQISERPARVALGRPLVVVLRPSPQREARVGRRTTAHQAAPGQRDRTPALVRLRYEPQSWLVAGIDPSAMSAGRSPAAG